MRRLILVVVCLACSAGVLWAAGSITWTVTAVPDQRAHIYSAAWTADGSGDVTGNARSLSGQLSQVRIRPGTGGDQPDDNYDLTLNDASGIDLLAGAGANLDQTVGTYVVFDPPILLPSGGTLDLVIAGAGAANKGTVELWIQP